MIGKLCLYIAVSRFARTLSTLVASGVSILEALDITKDIVGNEVLAKKLVEVRASVEKGESIFVYLEQLLLQFYQLRR